MLEVIDQKVYWNDVLVSFTDFGGSVSYSNKHKTLIFLCNGGDPPDTVYFIGLDEVLSNPITHYGDTRMKFVANFCAWNNDIYISDEYVLGCEDRDEQILLYRVYAVPNKQSARFMADRKYTVELLDKIVHIMDQDTEVEEINLDGLYTSGHPP